jgi:hypothetical protein
VDFVDFPFTTSYQPCQKHALGQSAIGRTSDQRWPQSVSFDSSPLTNSIHSNLDLPGAQLQPWRPEKGEIRKLCIVAASTLLEDSKPGIRANERSILNIPRQWLTAAN